MEAFATYLAGIGHPQARERTEMVLRWVMTTFPNLMPKIAWNQPMFTDHGTFIIGFSVSNHHLAISPEPAGIDVFSNEIRQAGYDHSKQLLRIKWEQPVDFTLLEKIIQFNISDKADSSAFWRK